MRPKGKKRATSGLHRSSREVTAALIETPIVAGNGVPHLRTGAKRLGQQDATSEDYSGRAASMPYRPPVRHSGSRNWRGYVPIAFFAAAPASVSSITG
jgi:hypothetical protein